jgi:hypothetical protein
MEMLNRPVMLRSLILTLFSVAFVPSANASNDPGAQCVSAARTAAQKTGVPFEVLLAISVVETGRDFRPWPWTVNLGGEGHWLMSADEAAKLVQDALDQGATNIDLGCFQLNYRWHAAAFATIGEMLDPDRNALYAAEFLSQQHTRTGNWALAAAAYHSGTPEYADRYRARYEETFAELGNTSTIAADPSTRRSNGFPLLVTGTSGRKGSLVPATPIGSRLLGRP